MRAARAGWRMPAMSIKRVVSTQISKAEDLGRADCFGKNRLERGDDPLRRALADQAKSNGCRDIAAEGRRPERGHRIADVDSGGLRDHPKCHRVVTGCALVPDRVEISESQGRRKQRQGGFQRLATDPGAGCAKGQDGFERGEQVVEFDQGIEVVTVGRAVRMANGG